MFMNALVLFDGSIEDLRDFLFANLSPTKTIFDFNFRNPDETEIEKNRLLAVFALIDDVDFRDKDIDLLPAYFLDYASKISDYHYTLSLDKSFRGLYLFDSILNYSNTPNTVALQFDTKKLHLAIRPIQRGEFFFTFYR